ncbi:spore photoproduct lyase family protein [Actinomycetospora aeridis]|uniref:Spore photoproduct lyase family protein n=1 Tax=Actinomycetospora aeridis TaxID=3129231 RepID=A0ABU8N9H8_9PSEU
MSLLEVATIHAEPASLASVRGQEVLARFPDAEVVEIDSHWAIPDLHGDETNVARWVRVKAEHLVLGEKKSLTVRPNGRSADFIAPSTANGCAMACAYCYVPRRKGYANPITVFTNIDGIQRTIARHVAKQGRKPEPNQCDPVDWVYDLGENSDCSVDARVSDNVADLVAQFARLDGAKASFATKHVNRDLLDLDPRGGTRVRFSLMPRRDAKLLDIRTSTIDERIAVIDDFVAAGYEVHLNFSPVVLRERWQSEWALLLDELGERLPERAKAQAACEVILLTHHEGLHEVNLGWHPLAEEVLWRPEAQEAKRTQHGGAVVRYRLDVKRRAVARFRELVARHAPWLTIRYAF